MKKNKVVILDNGHGKNTPGKCSPDKIFYEWSWSRTFVNTLKTILENQNYIVFNIVPEEENISLYERAERANTIINKYGAKNCIFISIHNNAAGNGSKWYNASGWEVFTTKGKTNSDKLAEYLCEACLEENIKFRTDISDGDMDKEEDFTVIYKTNCPAVLTENMFMDSKSDVEFLQSEQGINKLINIHVNGINRYFNNL
jgi:N-acetylmuramoyl-L-alanine amidase